MRVNQAMLQARQVNLGSSSVHLLFDLIYLLFNLTEPLVKCFFHFSRIDAAILNDLCALDQAGSCESWRCHLLQFRHSLIKQEQCLVDLGVRKCQLLLKVLAQITDDTSLNVMHLAVDLLR